MSDDARRDVEIRRWLAESDKFVAEQRKLMAEAAKFERERWTSIILALAAMFGALAAFLSIGARIAGWG